MSNVDIFRGETVEEGPEEGPAANWPAIQTACAKHKRFVVEVRPYNEEREVTLRQYAYFHAVVVPMIAEAMSSSLWESEYWCKKQCGEQWELIKKVGKGMWVECSKTKLNVTQFNQWLENIWSKAETMFGILIPPPDKDWRETEQKLREART
jgi:hypothetical protein